MTTSGEGEAATPKDKAQRGRVAGTRGELQQKMGMCAHESDKTEKRIKDEGKKGKRQDTRTALRCDADTHTRTYTLKGAQVCACVCVCLVVCLCMRAHNFVVNKGGGEMSVGEKKGEGRGVLTSKRESHKGTHAYKR